MLVFILQCPSSHALTKGEELEIASIADCNASMNVMKDVLENSQDAELKSRFGGFKFMVELGTSTSLPSIAVRSGETIQKIADIYTAKLKSYTQSLKATLHTINRETIDAKFNECRFLVVSKTNKSGSVNDQRDFARDIVREGAREMEKALARERRGTIQFFVLNASRDIFADPRVRRAFNYAFHFQLVKQAFSLGPDYRPMDSFFEDNGIATKGAPQGRELEILTALRNKYPDFVPSAALGAAYQAPEGGDRYQDRKSLSEAARLLREAGWLIQDNRLVHKDTLQPLTVDFLTAASASPAMEAYILRLRPLGIVANLKRVDPATYQYRLRNHEFDIVTEARVALQPPETEAEHQRFVATLFSIWNSISGGRPAGSETSVNAAVDDLLGRIKSTHERAELLAMIGALNRIWLWNDYVVPQFHRPAEIPPAREAKPGADDYYSRFLSGIQDAEKSLQDHCARAADPDQCRRDIKAGAARIFLDAFGR
jgi:hypothetical protein